MLRAAPRRHRPYAPALALLLCAGSCAGSGIGIPEATDLAGPLVVDGGRGDGKSFAASFQSFQDTIFTPICTHCHAGASAPKAFQLDAANSYAMLVNVPSVELPSMKRVAPGDPDHSYIVVKLAGINPPMVGAQMPYNGPPYLAPAQIDAIRTWIKAGAKR